MSRRTMPAQKPGRSIQSVRTPDNFLTAAQRRLGPFWIDLAATKENRVVKRYYSPKDDALSQPWCPNPVMQPHLHGRFAWCNPPYADLAPWVRKGLIEAQGGASIAMLVPAGVGSNWWRDYVHHQARVLLLNGRLTFKGHDSPYPKDLALILFSPDVAFEYEVWNWRKFLIDGPPEA
jgi:phage N-6-adenine-methyltransferase